jgi:hypothetical protein
VRAYQIQDGAGFAIFLGAIVGLGLGFRLGQDKTRQENDKTTLDKTR